MTLCVWQSPACRSPRHLVPNHRVGSLVWWTLTLQLPRRIRLWRQARRTRCAAEAAPGDGSPCGPCHRPSRSRCLVTRFAYPPNEDAACWLARDIMRLVRRQVPATRLATAGSHPTVRVKALADGHVTVATDVSDAKLRLVCALVLPPRRWPCRAITSCGARSGAGIAYARAFLFRRLANLVARRHEAAAHRGSHARRHTVVARRGATT
jgi:hypothetical protein